MVEFLRIWVSYYPEDFSTLTFNKLVSSINTYKDLLPTGYRLARMMAVACFSPWMATTELMWSMTSNLFS